MGPLRERACLQAVIAAVLVLGAAAVTAAGGGRLEAVVAVYDASGAWPKCSQGVPEYMESCVWPSDLSFYVSAAQPTLGPVGVSCGDLAATLGRNWSFVGRDPVFDGAEFYWEGGADAWKSFSAQFRAGHDGLGDLGSFLRHTYLSNSACVSASPAVVPENERLTEGLFKVREAATAAFFDASGDFPQCVEGALSYLRDCVLPASYLPFMLSTIPTIREGTCAHFGFEFVEPDPVFDITIYWAGGATAANQYLAKYLPAHPQLNEFENRSRDDTAACTL